MSITPEIGDDIVRVVRAMNEAMQQERLSKGQYHYGGESSVTADEKEENVSDSRFEYATNFHSTPKQKTSNADQIELPICQLEDWSDCHHWSNYVSINFLLAAD